MDLYALLNEKSYGTSKSPPSLNIALVTQDVLLGHSKVDYTVLRESGAGY